jgi:filamentous hemagglutinin
VLGKLFGSGTADGAQVLAGEIPGAKNGEGLFAGVELGTYTPKSPVLGQAYDFSCAAASCKMAAGLSDVPETYIRNAIQTDASGTSLSDIPAGLQQLGFTGTARYVKDATVASIESATKDGASVIASVTTDSGGVHAIVVDSVKGGVANIRDPWPIGIGSTYSVPVDALQRALTGRVVIVHP